MPLFIKKSVYLLIVILHILFIGTNNRIYAGNHWNIFLKSKNRRKLDKKWNGESIRHSISLFQEAADLWLENNQPDNAANCLREITKLNLILSKPAESLSLLEKISKTNSKNQNFQSKIENLCLRSRINLDLGKVDESKNNLDAAVKLLRQSDNNKNHISVLMASANYYFSKHNNPKALELYDKSLAIALKIDDKTRIAEINYEVSYIQMTNADFIKAGKNADAALQAYKAIANERGIALSTLALGTLAWLIDNKRLALKYYNEASALFPNDISFYDKAILLNGFASVYEDYGELEISLNYRKQALDSINLLKVLSGKLPLCLECQISVFD